ncbi:MAG: DUF6599 family protein [Thermodesulfobacteriota bacterium]|nr:DUF6599 family protein [Thermodesulfobacteriota bacterium]
MPSTTRRVTKAETILSLSIIVFLVAIVLVILSVQNRFNPAVENFAPINIRAEASYANDPADDLFTPLPDGIETMSPAESFTPDALSNKINGKAELYLSAGFVQLQAQRFRPTDDPEAWFEVFVYDMGTPSNAFAVYSTQRRKDVEKIPLAQHAYRTANAFFFIAGRHYVEMIAATRSEAVPPMLIAFTEKYLDHVQADDQTEAEASDPKSVFPTEGLIADSLALIAKDAFGFSRLDQVYTAQYHGPDIEMSLFVSLRSSSKEAQTLAGAYRDFLIQFGGTEVAAPGSSLVEGLFTIRIMDAHELIFSRGPYLAGVHMADDIDTAGQLAAKMDRKLADRGVAR